MYKILHVNCTTMCIRMTQSVTSLLPHICGAYQVHSRIVFILFRMQMQLGSRVRKCFVRAKLVPSPCGTCLTSAFIARSARRVDILYSPVAKSCGSTCMGKGPIWRRLGIRPTSAPHYRNFTTSPCTRPCSGRSGYKRGWGLEQRGRLLS